MINRSRSARTSAALAVQLLEGRTLLSVAPLSPLEGRTLLSVAPLSPSLSPAVNPGAPVSSPGPAAPGGARPGVGGGGTVLGGGPKAPAGPVKPAADPDFKGTPTETDTLDKDGNLTETRSGTGRDGSDLTITTTWKTNLVVRTTTRKLCGKTTTKVETWTYDEKTHKWSEKISISSDDGSKASTTSVPDPPDPPRP